MRVIAGKLGSRVFEAPRTPRTHPMSEKARGALFNTLGDIEGLSVLDAFAGSGALSFEAISRGAKSAMMLELDKEAYKYATKNVDQLGLENQATILRANNKSWSKNNRDLTFDIVLLDPPYNDLYRNVLQQLSTHAKVGGAVVLSWPGKEIPPTFEGLNLLTAKNYGDAQLVFYRKIQ